MDEHNVHQLWGSTPCMDLASACEGMLGDEFAQGGVFRSLQVSRFCLFTGVAPKGGAHPDRRARSRLILQICSYDCRHVVATICRASRHPAITSFHLSVYEEEPTALARHMLLLHVLMDGSLTSRERTETFLELHGNALLRDKTAAYLGACLGLLLMEGDAMHMFPHSG